MKNPESIIAAEWPMARFEHHRLCLAISGGADSTALLCAFARMAHQSGQTDRLLVAHVNHGARGDESDGDALFVRQIAEQYGLDFDERYIEHTQLKEMVRRTGSWENAARELRYQYLCEMALNGCARYIATAHTQNDQLETILQRIFRGTGWDGLCAIPRIRPLNDSLVLIRPLLTLGRDDILNYLETLHQSFRNDSSNATDAYLRNRIRHELAPVLDRLFPEKWQNSLLRLSHLAEEMTREETARYNELHEKAVVYQKGQTELIISLSDLKSANTFFIGVFFRHLWKEQKWHLGEMGQNQWARLTQLALKKEGREEFPGGIIAVAKEGFLKLIQNTFEE